MLSLGFDGLLNNRQIAVVPGSAGTRKGASIVDETSSPHP
jgi:hypothetical protein